MLRILKWEILGKCCCWKTPTQKPTPTRRQQFSRSNQSKSNFLPKALAKSRSLVTYAKLTKNQSSTTSTSMGPVCVSVTECVCACVGDYANGYVACARRRKRKSTKVANGRWEIFIFYICLISAAICHSFSISHSLSPSLTVCVCFLFATLSLFRSLPVCQSFALALCAT